MTTWSTWSMIISRSTGCHRSQLRILRPGYKRYYATASNADTVNIAVEKNLGDRCVSNHAEEYPFEKESAPMLSAALRRARQLPTTARVTREPQTNFLYLALEPEWHEVAPTFFRPRALSYTDDDDDDDDDDEQITQVPRASGDLADIGMGNTNPDSYWTRRFLRYRNSHIVGVGKNVDEKIRTEWHRGANRLKQLLTVKYDGEPCKLMWYWYFPLSPIGAHISLNSRYERLLGEDVTFEVVRLRCFRPFNMGEPSKFDHELFHAYRLTFEVMVTIDNETLAGHCSYACLGARVQPIDEIKE